MISWPVWIATLLFALIHSLFATELSKKWFYRHFQRWNLSPQRYRLLYSIFATLFTLLWLIYIYRLPDQPLYTINGWKNWLLYSLQLIGAGIALYSLRSFNTAAFLGLARYDDPDAFHEHGLYRFMRHPMYSGVMLLLLASPVQSVNSFNLALAVSLYFIIGARFEESRMIKLHPDYPDYRRRVAAFIPGRAIFRSLFSRRGSS